MDKDKKLLKQLWDRLDDKEKTFVDIYQKTRDKRKAYATAMGIDDLETRAGYHYAKRVNIQAYLAQVDKLTQHKTEVTAQWIVEQLAENSEIAKDSGKISDSNRALELLGKNLSMFTDSVTVKGIDELVSKLQDKGDALADQVDE